jgi:UDP-2,4-diacetamido-2,4,6-trideoxy-beta-L-altropyranose hydrolase
MQNNFHNCFIRVDASNKIGAGHLIRCLAIADFLKTKNINAIFLSRSENIKQQIINRGFKVELLSADSTIEEEYCFIKSFKIENKIKFIIVDINNYNTFKDRKEYHLYLKSLKKLSLFLISLEDFKNYPYPADIVVIPYFGFEGIKLYDRSDCKYLLGPKYFVLRKEFLKAKPVIVRNKINNILITMGGSDSEGITLKVLKALNIAELDVNLKLIIGGLSQIDDDAVSKSLRNYKGTYSVMRSVNNMAELMSKSDIAVINSGLTKYETSALGLPGIVISNNEYHSNLMDDFAEYNSVWHLGPVNDVSKLEIVEAVTSLAKDSKKRSDMAEAGRLLIDGNGINRIFSEIPRELFYAKRNK